MAAEARAETGIHEPGVEVHDEGIIHGLSAYVQRRQCGSTGEDGERRTRKRGLRGLCTARVSLRPFRWPSPESCRFRAEEIAIHQFAVGWLLRHARTGRADLRPSMAPSRALGRPAPPPAPGCPPGGHPAPAT